MSMPNIPDITPDIKLKRKDVINLLIASIALEEIGLSHILNAEGEKLQFALQKCNNVKDVLKVNRSIESSLRAIIKKEMLLQFKLEDALRIKKKAKKKHKGIFSD